MILVIDNYDSFTYNLVQYLKEMTPDVIIRRNDAITIRDIQRMDPDMILLSPGPGAPDQAGICLEVVKQLHTTYPILGICLGHQTIVEAFGGTVTKAGKPMHGKVTNIFHDKTSMFYQIPSPCPVTRYHSLTADREKLPDCLQITSWTAEEEIMGVRHKNYPVEGVQFHPEAILTEHGFAMLKNYILNHTSLIEIR
ncbi:MAG: aminodeoxychorismate/anthranilate synthase component II [Bacillaceae bacterium]|nr:aminodeoxychorismate/anthranilate synthase component II [Bacillaceae bacterium]